MCYILFCFILYGHNCKFIPTLFSILLFFFLTKQVSFLSIYFSILPTKHIWEKTKSLLSSHFSISFPFFILPISTPPTKWTLIKKLMPISVWVEVWAAYMALWELKFGNSNTKIDVNLSLFYLVILYFSLLISP